MWRENDRLPHPSRGPVARDPRLELEMSADQYERLVTHLEQFIVMDDVELATLTGNRRWVLPVRWRTRCWNG